MAQTVKISRSLKNHLNSQVAIRFIFFQSEEKIKKESTKRLIPFLLSCEGRTRTCDLQVMSLASYQLLHLAI